MDIDNIQSKLYFLQHNRFSTLDHYHEVLRSCVNLREMEAVVYVYDKIKSHGLTPSKETFEIIDPLHSKTILENKNLRIPKELGKKTLAPRRRIHKIMKGHYYTDKHTEAMKYVEKVKGFLDNYPDYKKHKNRFFLAETIQSHIHIPLDICRVIVTHLKRTKYLPSTQVSKPTSLNKPSVFEFSVSRPSSSQPQKKFMKQQKIVDYFK